MPTPEQISAWSSALFHAVTLGVSLLGSLIAALVPLFPFLLPMLIPAILRKFNRYKNGDTAAAADAISRAGLIASTRFAQVLEAELKRAQLPDSPGGVAITDQERFQATVTAGKASVESLPPGAINGALDLVVDEAMERMRRNDELTNAVKAYDGSEALVRDSLRRRIQAKTDVPGPGGGVGSDKP